MLPGSVAAIERPISPNSTRRATTPTASRTRCSSLLMALHLFYLLHRRTHTLPEPRSKPAAEPAQEQRGHKTHWSQNVEQARNRSGSPEQYWQKADNSNGRLG